MYFRDNQERLKQLEEKKKDSGNTSDQKEDSFETPIGKNMPRLPVTSTPLTPASSNQSKGELSFESDVALLDNSGTSLTPSMESLGIGGKRGRKRKDLQPPSMDKFPHNGTDKQKKAFMKSYNARKWRYEQLTGTYIN